MNLVLVRLGYPPVIIFKRQRTVYLAAICLDWSLTSGQFPLTCEQPSRTRPIPQIRSKREGLTLRDEGYCTLRISALSQYSRHQYRMNSQTRESSPTLLAAERARVERVCWQPIEHADRQVVVQR